jgi:NTP pyrophosphatase (non-canonical NTP hydrolase)
MTRKEAAKEVVLYKGNEHQKLKAIEELSELIRAISKDDRKNIIEEIGDVKFLLKQLQIIYLIDKKEIDLVLQEKIDKIIYKIYNQKSKDRRK